MTPVPKVILEYPVPELPGIEDGIFHVPAETMQQVGTFITLLITYINQQLELCKIDTDG